MKFIKILGICLLFSQQAFSLPNTPIKHKHNGRTHTHILPITGINHLHNEALKTKKNINGIFIRSLKTSTINSGNGFYSSNTLQVVPILGTKKVKLLETLTYTEPNGKKWVAPKGHIVDGASIPAFFQPIVGTPYGGKYVMASVIHDVACDNKKDKWQSVHKAFYYAMLASGVSKSKAKLMYDAVYRGGPRWGKDAEKVLSEQDFKGLIIKGHYKELVSDFNIKDPISLSLIGQLKAYDGVVLYSGKKHKIGEYDKLFFGVTKQYKDFTFIAHRDIKDLKRHEYKTTYGVEFNYTQKIKVSARKNVGDGKIVSGVGIGYTGNQGSHFTGTAKDYLESNKRKNSN